MTFSSNQDEMGVEVHISPSYWNKWSPKWNDDAEDTSDAPSIVSNEATSSGNAAGSRMSMKKKSLLAISIAAVSIGGAFFALNGTKNTANTVDESKLHKVEDALELCEDVRRVLVVPGSEEFQPSRESSNKMWQMRLLNRKGNSAGRRKVSSIKYYAHDTWIFVLIPFIYFVELTIMYVFINRHPEMCEERKGRQVRSKDEGKEEEQTS